jgi:pimeloyl-ACP methyl ester carboxylesterase
MAITNIEILSNLSSTALATYGSLDVDNLKISLINQNLGANFTETQADSFVERYELKHQLPNQLSGFSATLFWDKLEEKHVLAIRGTELDLLGIPTDGISADFLGIGATGYAREQAADLYRYWKQLITPEGLAVSYTTTELVQLYMLETASSFSVSEIISSTAFLLFQSTFNGDVGLGLVDRYEQVDVTGHSLGGHLAMLFARMFPSNTDQVVTLNAPDIFSHGNLRLNMAGFTVGPDYNGKITQLNAEGDIVTILGNITPGTQITFAQEVSDIIANHSSANGVDGLNLMALMATIDPSLSNQTAAFLSSFVRASSNLPFNSYEVLLDGLRRFFMGSDIASTIVAANFSGPARESFYANMKALGDLFTPDAALAHMVGNIYLVPATGVEARNDYGQFLALYFATPFALEGGEPFLSQLHTSLYDRWKSDQSLTDAERENGQANFSDQWYEDRSAYLTALLSRNENDIDATDSANSYLANARHFAVDGINQHRAIVYTGAANADNFASINTARIVFGDDAANTPANSGADAFIDSDRTIVIDSQAIGSFTRMQVA